MGHLGAIPLEILFRVIHLTSCTRHRDGLKIFRLQDFGVVILRDCATKIFFDLTI